MAVPLLKTKLYIPLVRPDPSTALRTRLVSRLRLLEQLNAGLHRKLTLISAPAGFGKTTLLGEWVHTVGASPAARPQRAQQAAPLRVGWVSLDKGDNDPARFWAYCIGALQRVQPGIGETALAALQSRQPPSAEALLTGLINEIAPIQSPLVLVLDDFHVITDQQVHDGDTFLLGNLPPQMHLILSSRSDPPWPLARLRARGELNELRASDLRFTPEEASTFLNDVMGLGLSAEDVAALDARTEGWIAGLQMAALTMRGRKDVAAFIKTFSGVHRFILDYLVEEVLDQQSAAIRRFLLQTSILGRLAGPLCDAVTGGSGSQAILIQLERANLFLVPLDDERRWYRYHHLFADLLRSRLEQSPPSIPPASGGDERGGRPASGGDERGGRPASGGDERGGRPASGGDERGGVPTLHRRASEWYEQNGLILEAVSHALAAGDIDRVANLVEGNAFAMMDHGELTTLVGWLDALPDEVVRSRPWLSVSHAWALAYAGHLDAVEPLLQVAEEALRNLDEAASADVGIAVTSTSAVQALSEVEGPVLSEVEGPVLSEVEGPVLSRVEGPVLSRVEGERIAGHIAAIRGYAVYIRGDLTRAEEFTRQALEHLPEGDVRARGLPTALLGSVLKWGGDLAAAAQVSTEAVAISQAAGDGHVAVHAVCDLAGLHIMQGRLNEAIGDCRDALQIAGTYAGRGGQQLPVAGHAYAFMSAVLLERNDLDAALRNARQGLELCKLCGQADVLTTGYRSFAGVLQAIGDEDGALSAIREARQVAASVSPWYAAEGAAWEARLRLAQGHLAAAARWVQESGLAADDEISFQNECQYRTLARVFIAQDRWEEALGLLTRLLKVEEEAGAMGRVIEILVLQALALRAQGEVEQAVTALERALTLAEPEGYVRTFIDEGAPMGRLLRQVAARGIAVKCVAELLAALDAEMKDEEPALSLPKGGMTKPVASSLVHRLSSVLVDPLTERELEVLRLLRTNLSSPEIAEQLFVAPSTVRSHTKSIYGKLNVHSRREAVERAKELGLL